MQCFRRSIGLVQRHAIRISPNPPNFSSTRGIAISSCSGFRSLDPNSLIPNGFGAAKVVENSVSLSKVFKFRSLHGLTSQTPLQFTRRSTNQSLCGCGAMVLHVPGKCMSTVPESAESSSSGHDAVPDVPPPWIKFKRLDKTARHIMQIVDKEAVENVKTEREIPDIRPGYIVELKVVVPENKRRLSIIKGIVIARRNAGLNSTIRIRRLVAGVGVESLLPLYSPNIKEIKVLDKKKVRRAKLYYLRDKMNALKKN